MNTANSIRFVKFATDQMAGAVPTAAEAAAIYAGTAIATVTPTGASNPYTATYTWNSADFPNATNAAITYYVYAILSTDAGADCRPTQEIQIMVSPTVTAGTATNPAPICQNGSGLANVDLFGQLASEMTGGAWSQTAGTAVGTALNASTGSLNPNGLAVGTYTFTYTVTGISPCPNSTANVTIIVEQCCPPKICLPITVVRN
jgi:endoglucanase